jgi:hypothetical protein
MKKIIRLTENDLIRIVKRVIKEQEGISSESKLQELEKELKELKGVTITKDGSDLVLKGKGYTVTVDEKEIHFYIPGNIELSDEIDQFMQNRLNTVGKSQSYNHTRENVKALASTIRMLISKIQSGLVKK